ncbi:MAG: translocation/assembly module TamB domain-containing protein [Mangrovibacterium sp.]
MKGVQSAIRKTLKVIMWATLILILLFFLFAGIIRIPAIQTRLVQYATSFVSSKTHTTVELKKISISFPTSVVIEGLYLEDTQKDTLLYAGNVKVNIALYDLLFNKINLSSVSLTKTTVKLYSTITDPLFNYNFLITAFADTTRQVKADTLKASKWSYSLNRVFLKDIRFSYNDIYSGMNVFVAFEKAKLTVNELAPDESIYNFNELLLEHVRAEITRVWSGKVPSDNSTNVLPTISAENLQIRNSMISYVDTVAGLSVLSAVDQLELKEASIDLPKQLLASGYLHVSKSEIRYHTFGPEQPPEPVDEPPVPSSGQSWKITLDRIDLSDNSLIFKTGNTPEIKNRFDPYNLEYNRLSLEATEFQYSSSLTKALITKFSATDKNKFEITGFETDFRMDQYGIAARKVKLRTPHSAVDADFNIEYSSLSALTDSMQFRNLDLDFRNVSIRNSDMLYFNPKLAEQPFFKNRMNVTSISGKVNGSTNDLTSKNLLVKTGTNTVLQTDFNIRGLPDLIKASYHFPNLKISSGKKDITMLAGSSIPENIELPEQISVALIFKGQIKSFESTAGITSSFGDARLMATVDPQEKFNATVSINQFNLGQLLKDSVLYGPVSLTAEVNGQGLDPETIQAKIKAEATELYLNQYAYHNLKMDGSVSGRQFEGKINLDDENAVFDFGGLVNLNPGQEHVKFKLNVLGADLQKLRFTKNDVQVSFVAAADLKGGSVDRINGTAGINNISIDRDGKKYRLDSFLTATVNDPDKSEIEVSSALIDINYSGTVSPIALPDLLKQFVNNYFQLSDSVPQTRKSGPSNFNFGIQFHNHPILSKVLLPQLKEFEPGMIQGSFDRGKKELKLNVSMKKIVYGTTEIKDFAVAVNSDSTALNYKISSSAVSNAQVSLDNFSFDGKLADNRITANISSTDGKNKKLLIMSQISKENGNYKLTLDPANFYLVNNQWNIAADNFIEFGKQGFKIHHFFIDHTESQINIASVNDQFNDDLNIAVINFRLDDLSRIIEKDTAMIKGTVNGNVLLKRVAQSYGLIADIGVVNLIVREVPIGNLTLKAARTEAQKFELDLNLSGPDNNLTANGYFIPTGNTNSIRIETLIQSLSLKTIEAFSMGQITEAEGTLAGNFLVEGTTTTPELTGELVFNNAFLKPSFLNNRLGIKDETIRLKKDGIYFDTFTLTDRDQHTAIIDGSVLMKQFSGFIFALQVNTTDFLLFNTTAKDNKEFFGRLVIDSKIRLTGPMSLPVVNAKVKLKEGSNFTFAVPEGKLTTDKGENVVEFENSFKFHPILTRGDKKGGQTTGMTGFDLSSIVEIDKEATLRLLMDPASTDSLVVKGEAALSFTMDQSGKMSLTGAYHLSDGSYMVSLESVIKKRFDIEPGSTIIWNGDPLDADISIDANYTVRASPYDLVADQISGLSDVDKGGYKLRYPFSVILRLRGAILHPAISFKIQLSPEDKGILGGAVDQKLNLLNDDESALNKQVFALLVLGRFVQENPFQTESATGTSTLIRSTVSKFLSAQLNQLSSNVIPGMELNFDIQSYEDYQTGQAQGRTQVEIGMKQQLFNERLSVELGGSVDVEGDQAKQNSASDITSDVTVEYKLTKDGRLRMKGFRHNQYEGAIEGQLVETGVGVVYVRDFNR